MSDNSISKVEKSEVWDAVITSGVLGSSKNQNALFKYILGAKFNGTTSDIKTKQIAIHVFDRDNNFSTKKDSIVRVEMHRLRANLDSFNLQSDNMKLNLPKSSYDLQIDVTKPDIQDMVIQDGGPLKTIRKNRIYGAGALIAAGLFAGLFAGAFWQEEKGSDCSKLIPNMEISERRDKNAADEASLHMYVDQVIRGAASQFGHLKIVKDVESCGYTGVPGYKLEYTLLQNGSGVNGSLSTMSVSDNKIINVSNFSGIFEPDKTLPADDSDLYFTIVQIINDLLGPGSIVHTHAAKQNWKDEVRAQDYSCLAEMYQSFVSDSNEDYYTGLACLKQSYENGTPLLDNLGGLAASYLEQAMGNRGAEGNDPLLIAQEIMDSIGDHWLENPETTIAKIMYDTVRPDYNDQQLRVTLFEAEKAYSSHATVMIEVSRYYGFMLGDWDNAVRVMDRAKRLTSGQTNSVFHVDAAYALLAQSNPEAWSDCVKAYSQYSKMSNLLVNACAKKYAKPVWEQQTKDNLNKLNLKTSADKKQFLKNMRFEAGLTTAILSSEKNTLYD